MTGGALAGAADREVPDGRWRGCLAEAGMRRGDGRGRRRLDSSGGRGDATAEGRRDRVVRRDRKAGGGEDGAGN